jgi:hypothetical protein
VNVDPTMWRAAVDELGLEAAPTDPGELDRGSRIDLAEELQAAGWSFRDMSAALGVPTTTLHRSLSDGSATTARATESGGSLLIAGLLGAAFGAALWRGRRSRDEASEDTEGDRDGP